MRTGRKGKHAMRVQESLKTKIEAPHYGFILPQNSSGERRRKDEHWIRSTSITT